jgi:hypothetical protein
MKELESIYITSGVNEKGNGFLTIAAHSTAKEIMMGQLDPETVRSMALDWLASAEAAEQDAAVLRIIRKLDLPDQVAGLVITELRESREGNEK